MDELLTPAERSEKIVSDDVSNSDRRLVSSIDNFQLVSTATGNAVLSANGSERSSGQLKMKLKRKSPTRDSNAHRHDTGSRNHLASPKSHATAASDCSSLANKNTLARNTDTNATGAGTTNTNGTCNSNGTGKSDKRSKDVSENGDSKARGGGCNEAGCTCKAKRKSRNHGAEIGIKKERSSSDGLPAHTVSLGTLTEPKYFGPCEPGTQVNLGAEVWFENDAGMLSVSVNWRGRSYAGVLMDTTQLGWAPPQPAPSADEVRPPRGGRKRRAAQSPFSGVAGRRPAPLPGRVAPPARRGRPQEADDSSQHSVSSEEPPRPANSSTDEDDCLLSCPESGCQHRYRNATALKHHRAHAHAARADQSQCDPLVRSAPLNGASQSDIHSAVHTSANANVNANANAAVNAKAHANGDAAAAEQRVLTIDEQRTANAKSACANASNTLSHDTTTATVTVTVTATDDASEKRSAKKRRKELSDPSNEPEPTTVSSASATATATATLLDSNVQSPAYSDISDTPTHPEDSTSKVPPPLFAVQPTNAMNVLIAGNGTPPYGALPSPNYLVQQPSPLFGPQNRPAVRGPVPLLLAPNGPCAKQPKASAIVTPLCQKLDPHAIGRRSASPDHGHDSRKERSGGSPSLLKPGQLTVVRDDGALRLHVQAEQREASFGPQSLSFMHAQPLPLAFTSPSAGNHPSGANSVAAALMQLAAASPNAVPPFSATPIDKGMLNALVNANLAQPQPTGSMPLLDQYQAVFGAVGSPVPGFAMPK